jgi:hypothetical protein
LRHQKLDLGTVLVGLGALGLLVSLFLDWYSPTQASSLTAWDAFEVFDWALAACAVLGLAGVALAMSGTPPSWLPAAAIVAFFGAASQVIDPPPAAHGATREVGAWLALGSAAAMAAGVALAAASIAIDIDVRGRERRRRVAAVDRRDVAEPVADGPIGTGLFTDPAMPPETDPERTQPLSPLDREALREDAETRGP